MVASCKTRYGFDVKRQGNARDQFYASPTVDNFYELERSFEDDNRDAIHRDGVSNHLIRKPERRTAAYVRKYYEENKVNYVKLLARRARGGDNKAASILRTRAEGGDSKAESILSTIP